MTIKYKVIMSTLMVVIILITNFMMVQNSVRAVSLIEVPQIELRFKGLCDQLLKYKGVIVKTSFVEYSYNGATYPAYCLDKTLKGVSDDLNYSVGINNKIEDLGLWRVIINGYPYKSLAELGVANEQEAFTATKQAIYCYLFENMPGDYEAIGEAGARTLNALNMIVMNGQNSTETQKTNSIEIKPESSQWLEDTENSKYLYKIYSLSSNASNLDYEIEVKGEMPEGSKITKLDGTENKKFSSNEKFKIMLLKESLVEDGNFQLNVKTEVKTKPIIYGASPNASWQNYALTAYMYEDAQTIYEDTYKKQEKPKIPETPKIPEIDNPKEEVKILPVTGM